jgi:hypothetical protein
MPFLRTLLPGASVSDIPQRLSTAHPSPPRDGSHSAALRTAPAWRQAKTDTENEKMDRFEFKTDDANRQTDKDHDKWSDLLSMGGGGKEDGIDDFSANDGEDDAALLLPAVQTLVAEPRRPIGDDEAEDSIVIDYGPIDF